MFRRLRSPQQRLFLSQAEPLAQRTRRANLEGTDTKMGKGMAWTLVILTLASAFMTFLLMIRAAKSPGFSLFSVLPSTP